MARDLDKSISQEATRDELGRDMQVHNLRV
jgi:hypothetical protein